MIDNVLHTCVYEFRDCSEAMSLILKSFLTCEHNPRESFPVSLTRKKNLFMKMYVKNIYYLTDKIKLNLKCKR